MITERQTLSRWSSVTSIRSLDSILSFNPDNFGADRTMTNEKEPDKCEALIGRVYERLPIQDGAKVDDGKYKIMQKQIQESKIISDTVLLAAKEWFELFYSSVPLANEKTAFQNQVKSLKEQLTNQDDVGFVDLLIENVKILKTILNNDIRNNDETIK